MTFLFAPTFHPATRHAGQVRRDLGVRTAFNLLGPLTNPAGAGVQLIGVYDPALTEPLACVLRDLGACAAMVIHGAGGADELTAAGLNRVSHLRDGQVTTYELDPRDLGLHLADVSELRGGPPDEAAQMMRDLLAGRRNGAYREAILLNAAGALAAESGDFPTALEEAADSLDGGRALAKMEALVDYSRSFVQVA
jgi:anthranilate phosphoribosyltransferase